MRLPKQSESVSRDPAIGQAAQKEGVSPAWCFNPDDGVQYPTDAVICTSNGYSVKCKANGDWTGVGSC